MTLEIQSQLKSTITQSIDVKTSVANSDEILKQISDASLACVEALKNGRKILIAGNGTSASDAANIVSKLVCKFEQNRESLPAIALTDNSPILTAITNDFGFEHVYSRQISSLGQQGDVFLGLSTSGNSANIINAITQASKSGLTTIALCGEGGKAKDIVDYSINVPSSNTTRIQECHNLIGYLMAGIIEKSVFGS
jgi:D-sedoheptulose 7-phosphate isomerase